jgi:TonB-linked SusC/RagA family outer membrane protein
MSGMKKLNLQLLVFRIFLMSCILTGFGGVTLGQQIRVTGTVTDGETNEPLPGVNIVVKGTFAGTVTNLDGEYTIELDNPDATLVFSYIGYTEHSEKVSSRTVIDVVLVPDRIGLDEVVVIGYGVIKKSDVTGAVSSVDTEEISKMVVSNAAQALQGRASGVLVTQNSGSPGDAFDIKIRGTGTINNSSPLYVVDGVIVENISHIPPDNIQSFEALKDAASSAIYGSRAANGVIIITTKTGSEGPAVINFSASFSLQDYWKKVEVMDPNEYMLFQQMGFREASQINKAYDAYNQDLSPEEMYRIVYENEPYEGQFVGNWLDLISQNGLVQKYSLSASGGSNKITYYVSGNIFDQKGLISGSGYNDLSLLADVNFKITERLGIRTNVNYSHARRNIVPDNTFSEAVTFSPLESTRDQFGLLTYTPYSNVMW